MTDNALKKLSNFNLDKFKSQFQEGVYSNGIHMIEAWWDYDKTVILFNDKLGPHTQMYPICFHSIVLNNYMFLGAV